MPALPDFVACLLDGTPHAQAKLLAAWDGLSAETQIAVFSTRARLAEELLFKALGSPNAYVRYLAASRYPVQLKAASWLWRAYLVSPESLEAEVEIKRERERERAHLFAGGRPIELDELKPDDNVVHADHGIGVYRGRRHMRVTETEGDYLHIEYAGGDGLYVPIDRINLVRRYVTGESAAPVLDDLDGTSAEAANTLLVKIAADSDPLVRYSQYRGAFYDLVLPDDASIDAFLAHPLPAILAAVGEYGIDGLPFARLVRRTLATGVLQPDQVAALVREYLTEPTRSPFASSNPLGGPFSIYVPGYVPHQRWLKNWQAFKALWELVPDVPDDIKRILVAQLPVPRIDRFPRSEDEFTKDRERWHKFCIDHGFKDIEQHMAKWEVEWHEREEFERSDIPESIIAALPTNPLTDFLERDDVDLPDFRKQVALSHKARERDDFDDPLIAAAVHRSFDLTDGEFQNLVRSDSPNLEHMAGAQDMRLVILAAAHDRYRAHYSGFRRAYRARLRGLKGSRRTEEVWELRLYRLVWQVVDQERPVPADFAWIKEHIVLGDVWATYMAIRRKASMSWSAFWKALSKHPDEKRVKVTTTDKRLHSIEQRLATLQKAVTSTSAGGPPNHPEDIADSADEGSGGAPNDDDEERIVSMEERLTAVVQERAAAVERSVSWLGLELIAILIVLKFVHC